MSSNGPSQPILFVVEHKEQAKKLVSALEADGYSFHTLYSLENPIVLPQGLVPSLAILWFSFSSPEALGELENLVGQLKQMGGDTPLPVLLILDQFGAHWVEPGFRLGVVDILTRPIHPLILRQRVRLILRARQTEQAVELHRQAEERFRTVSDFTYDWEYWIGEDGHLLYNSPSSERITGFASKAFMEDEQLLLEIVHTEDRQRIFEHYQVELHSNQAYSLDFRIHTAAGEERWLGHVCQPVYGVDGQPLGRRVSNRDNTQRILAEQAMLSSEKLSAMGRLLASLAHEINNPLQAMSANIELAMDFPLAESERRSCLEAVRQEIDRLVEINRGILDFVRPRKISIQPIPLQMVVDRAVFLARAKLKEHSVKVTVDLPASLPLASAAPDQVEQVCLNLIINAVEQMPRGGALQIGARSSETQVELLFHDSGPGIAPDALNWIFEPFYTTKLDGTGLGLAVSQRIIQQHGGSLLAHNSTEGGAVFTLRLPVYIESKGTGIDGMPNDPDKKLFADQE